MLGKAFIDCYICIYLRMKGVEYDIVFLILINVISKFMSVSALQI